MKKLYVIVLLSIMFTGNVNAQEVYYENNNGVKFTEHEYDKISEFYWEGYQEYLSNKDFELLKNNGLFENEIETSEIIDNNFNMVLSNEHTTANKSLKINKVCSSNCSISIVLEWINLPKVRSYDILGVYLDNTSIIKTGNVIVKTNKEANSYSYTNKSTNGIGTSFKLPTDVTSLKISQTLTVKKQGTIKASYQHATKNISYADSKKYTFNKNGIGGVFQFDDGIQDYYDHMNGVSIALK